VTVVAVERLRARPGLALTSVCAVLFLTFLDNTIVSVSLADVQTSLHSGVASLQWIVNGYMLAFAGLMLTGGTLGDLYGRKKLLLLGVLIFVAGSAVGALATSSGVLITGRVVMGVGAALCEPGTLSLIRHIYPAERARARALGVWTAVSGVSLAAGPILGGAIVSELGWTGIFWFNVLAGILVFAVAAATLTESADPEGRQLDLPGLVLGATALTTLTFAIIQGESAGFGTGWVVLLFACAGIAGGAFVAVERRVPDPVLRLEFFRVRAFSGANAVGFATSFALFAVFFFTALYLQLVAAYSGWKIAFEFVAMSAAMVAAGLTAARWTAQSGPRRPMALGCLLAGIGMFAVDALMKPDVSFSALAVGLAVVGFGLGLALVAVTASVLAIVPAERSGMAASTLNTSRELGGVLGVAILGAVVNAQLVDRLGQRLTEIGVPVQFRSIVVDAVTHGGLPTTPVKVTAPGAAGNLALVGKVIEAAKDAFGDGLHIALVLAAGILLAAAVTALLTAGGRRVTPSLRS
jgi:EmrB/QacA subfamily drug resistance transporter